MPYLQWDELDFWECLEVVPEVEEDGISYTYDVQHGDFRLLVTVRPMESLLDFIH